MVLTFLRLEKNGERHVNQSKKCIALCSLGWILMIAYTTIRAFFKNFNSQRTTFKSHEIDFQKCPLKLSISVLTSRISDRLCLNASVKVSTLISYGISRVYF